MNTRFGLQISRPLQQKSNVSMKILMVCLGNICRSPLAEGILKDKIQKKGLPWQVDSAGTGSWHTGEKPDTRSIKVARQYGIDISYQRARQIQPADLRNFDLILTMDENNHEHVLQMARQHGADETKVQMILNYLYPGQNQSVPDPYWNDNGFEPVFQMLNEACEKVVEQLGCKA